MAKIKTYFKRILVGLPIATIIGASFLPLRATGQQLLILFSLIWFFIFIVFDAFVR